MPVVKLIGNPNRSLNPFKGQFLLAMRNHNNGVVQGAGNFLFNHYVELIELEDHLNDYLTKKVENGDFTNVSKYPLDEDMSKAYLWYKTFFKNEEYDNELTKIWTDLRININKVDAFIEEELKIIWTGDNYIKEKIYPFINTLNKKPFFKESLKLMSAWIQLVCKYKNIQYEITERILPGGAKFDTFKVSSKSVPVDVQVKQVKEIKKKYSEYEKSLIKEKLLRTGAFTQTKRLDDDFLELYFDQTNIQVKREDLIKERKQTYISNLVNERDEIDFSNDYRMSSERLVSSEKEAISFLEREKNERVWSACIGEIGSKQDSEMTKNLRFAIQNKMFVSILNFIEYRIVNKKLLSSVSAQKSLMGKLRKSKIGSADAYYDILTEWMAEQGWNINQEPHTNTWLMLKDIIPSQDDFLILLDMQSYARSVKAREDEKFNEVRENVQSFYQKLKKFENSSLVVDGKTLQQEVQEKQEEYLKKAKTIYSEKFGVIEPDYNQSAYDVYLQIKLKSELRKTFSKNNMPEIVTRTVNEAGQKVKKHELVFRNLNKIPVYKQDNAGNVLMVDGQPVQETILDSKGNLIPVFKDVVLDTISYSVDRLSEEMIDAIPGVEREIELSDDHTDNPLRFTHMVKVKTTTINGITKDIITRGLYKGFSVEDLSNITGRIIGDGKSYSMNTKGEIVSRYESIDIDSGEVKVNIDVLEEPYITWARDRFLICLPKDKKYAPEIKTLKNLVRYRTSMEMVAGSHLSFYFGGSDYEVIKDSLGSCLMSKKAHEELRKYYEMLNLKLSHTERENYQEEKLKGIKSYLKFSTGEINALAWLEKNDYKGVVSLPREYGENKILFILSLILATQKLPDVKFLIVNTDRFVGSYFSGIEEYIEYLYVFNLRQSIEEIGYSEYIQRYKQNFNFKQYYCLVLDDANIEMNSDKVEAITNVKHPRKILLTDSAIQSSPLDLFRLVYLSTGNVVDKDKEKAFVEKYAVEIGGKFVGIKPEVKDEFYTWMKQNIHFMEKYIYTNLYKTTQTVNMPDEVASAYQDIAQEIQEVLTEMSVRYSYLSTNQIDLPADLQKEKDFALGNLKDKIGLLHLFSLNPHKAMVQYDRLKGNRPKDYTFSNPKIDQAEELAVHLVENSKRTVYFTEDVDVAKKTIIKISLRIPTKIHALCLSDSIVFYQAGKPLKKGVVNKNTKLQNFMLEELKDEEILKNLSRSGLSQVEIDDRMRRVAREEDEIGEEDVTWAVKTVKNFIAKNNQVATMVANSSYSRGFNLQQFNAVVHLDRDGWDSEELKQRTARLQGVGKEEPVTEYILDAVVGGSTSIDELRDRVQEVDQKFFSEILRESGALDLTKKYEAIEKLTTSKKVNLENFTRALLPTREMLAKIEEREKGLREDPIKYTQLDPNRFNHPSMENLSEHEKEMLDLTGFTGITNIASEHIKFRVFSDRENDMKSVGDWITTLHGTDRRKYYGENYIWNDAFTTNYCAPNGLGTHVLFSQLVAVKKAKLEGIACLGAGSFNSFDPETGEAKGQNYIGYYVWPKFGYNAEVLLNLDQIEEFANIFAKMVSQKLKWTEAITDGVKPIAPDPLDVGERPYKENYELDLDIEELMTNSGSSEERKQLQLKAILASTTPQKTVRAFALYVDQRLGAMGSQFAKDDFKIVRDYGYFKKKNYSEDVAYHIENRIAYYSGFEIQFFPFHKKNLKKTETPKYPQDMVDWQLHNAVLQDIEREKRLNSQWDFFATPLMKNYPEKIALFNKIQDTDMPLSVEEMQPIYEDMKQVQIENNIEYEETMKIYDERVEKYQKDLEEYNQAVSVYEQIHARYEKEFNGFFQQKINDISSFKIDKKEIQADLDADVYTSEIKSWLGNGKDWWKVRYAKSAFYLKLSNKISRLIEILDLYEITFKESDGKIFKAGEEWWKFVGTGTEYDLSVDPNSKSYKKLTKYVNHKVKEAGCENLEEYLSLPIEPFNTKKITCWISFLNDMAMRREEKLQIIKAYRNDLKYVLMNETQYYVGEFLETFKKWKMLNRITENIRFASIESGTKTYEQMMYEMAKQDSDMMVALDEQLANEEKVKQTEKDLSVLKGDLKPVTNPFGKKK